MVSVLKDGWEVKKLGEVCDFQGGSQPAKSKFIYEPKDGFVRFLQIRDFKNNKNITFIPESKKNRYCNEDDILLGRYGASVGKVLINKAGAYNVAVMKTIPNQNLLTKKYLFFYLNSVKFQKNLANVASRSAQDGFSKKDIFDFSILIPTLQEQKKIVAILDEAFSAIEKAKVNAELNLQNAKELFESYLQSIFENKSEDWERTILKNEIDLTTGFAFKSKFYTNAEDDILLIRGDNIMQGVFRWKDAKRWNRSEYDSFKKFQMEENDIVLAMDRPWVKAGLKCARVTKSDLPSLLLQRTARLRNKSTLDNSFLYYLINSKNFTDYLLGVQEGIGVPHISGKQISNYYFKKPSIKTQKEIVRKLNTLQEQTKKLEFIYKQKLQDLNELKKSILQKAFNGELL